MAPSMSLSEFVVEFHQGEGGSRHFKRSEIVADQGLVHPDAIFGQNLLYFTIKDVLFEEGRGAQARHQGDNLVAGTEGQVRQDHVAHTPCDLCRAFKRSDFNAGLSVVTDADLHEAGLNGEIGVTDFRDGAGGEADTHAARIVNGFLCGGKHFFQVSAHGGFGSADFPHQDLACHATALLPRLLG